MKEFNPLCISDELKKMYEDFIFSSFPIKDLYVKEKLKYIIENERLLWNGPFISAISRYKQGSIAVDFLKEERFDPLLVDLIKLNKFYKHQEDAIRSIRQDQHTIVSTGTGSGKTEAFVLPIIDYCLKNREEGLKAIIVYPMNALANDQMLRLRSLLYLINSKIDKPIRFSRYTGQTQGNGRSLSERTPYQKCKIEKTILGSYSFPGCPKNCDGLKLKPGLTNGKVRLICADNKKYENDFEILTRDEIRNSTPDILITNYVQLEYLLLRREDSDIFKSKHMKYLVFDEVHWYSGATGTEVALLIRRIKSRIKKYSNQEIICIGTSATISSAGKAKEDIANFASQIFGENVKPENIIVGERETVTETKGGIIPSEAKPAPLISAEELLNLGQEDFYNYLKFFSNDIIIEQNEDRLATLGKLLLQNKIFSKVLALINKGPLDIRRIIEALSLDIDLSSMPDHEQENLIWSYLYAGSIAIDPHLYIKGESQNLIRPQINIFFKTLGNQWPFGEIYICLKCKELYVKPVDKCICGGVIEELGICRFCGEIFFRAAFDGDPMDKSLGARATIGLDTTNNYKKIGILNRDYVDRFQWQTFSELSEKGFVHQKKCLVCGSLNKSLNNVCFNCRSDQFKDIFIKDKINTCPFCGNKYGPHNEAVSTIYMSPNTTSRLVFDLNFLLLPKDSRKMLIFTDSRQDASYMAGTIEEQHLNHMIRQIVTQLVWEKKILSYVQLEEGVLDVIKKVDVSVNEEEIKRKLLEEITSVTGRQRSTESLGLISIEYDIPITEEITIFANSINQSVEVFIKYLAWILNTIRQAGAIEGLNSRKIGKRVPTGYICEKGARKINDYSYTLNNILPLTRKNKFSSYTNKIFPDIDNIYILQNSFEMLKKFGYLVETKIGLPYDHGAIGFVLNRNRVRIKKPDRVLECNKCGSIFTETPSIHCSEWLCSGTLIEKELDEYIRASKKLYYINLYKDKPPIRLKVGEDTGYIPIDRRQGTELAFRGGAIDLLVATPTLELGIDIGDLSCVGLMKSPPTPANYAQRVGRAGRESQVSMATAFMFLNPIDFYYFDSPLEMIAGEILAPSININNYYIIRKHIHSLILEELIVNPEVDPIYYKKSMSGFVEEKSINSLLDSFENNKNLINEKIKSAFFDLNFDVDSLLSNFQSSIKETINIYIKEEASLQETFDSIQEQKRKLMKNRTKNVNAKHEMRRLISMETNTYNRLDDLNKSEFFSYLSYGGLIPRYSFPGKAVKVISDVGKDYADRQLPIALYELAPGMPIYLGGMKNEIRGLPLRQDPEMINTTTFYVCSSCKIYSRESINFSQCPECGAINSAIEIRDCYRPTAVVAKEIGKPSEEGREAVLAETNQYLLQPISANPGENKRQLKEFAFGEISGTVELIGKQGILTIVHGIKRYDRPSVETFSLCGECGFYLGGNFSQVDENKHKKHPDLLGRGFHEPSHILKDINLYHTFDTAAVLIKLKSSSELLVLTLKNALINASQRIVGADDGEIEGIVKDNNLIIYDNIEGGAGYVNTLFYKFNDIIDEMKNLVLGCDCEYGCLKCLYSYRRRRETKEIDKRVLIGPLKAYQRNTVRRRIDLHAKDMSCIPQENPMETAIKEFYIDKDAKCILSELGSFHGARELKDCIMSAKKSIFIVSLYISDTPIEWENNKMFSWYDILMACKVNGVQTIEIVVRTPRDNHDRAILNRLTRRGIRVYTIGDFDEVGIAHLKISLIDFDLKDGIAILQSANFSPEVIKNADFYIFLPAINNNTMSIFSEFRDKLIKRSQIWKGNDF